MAVTHPGFGPPTLTSSRASLQRPGTYLTHRRAELRVARALRDLQCTIPKLRVLPAPVKQVHRPTAVYAAILPRPLREAAGIAGALRCHVGGEKGEGPAALGRASRRRRLRACPRLQPPRLRASAGRAAPIGQLRGSNPGTDSNALLPGCRTSLPRPAETGMRRARLGARQLRAPPPTRASFGDLRAGRRRGCCAGGRGRRTETRPVQQAAGRGGASRAQATPPGPHAERGYWGPAGRPLPAPQEPLREDDSQAHRPRVYTGSGCRALAPSHRAMRSPGRDRAGRTRRLEACATWVAVRPTLWLKHRAPLRALASFAVMGGF